MCVASRGSVPEPEGLQAILVEDVEQIFSIGRNSGQGNVTVVSEIFDGHCFDSQSFFVWQERVNTEGSSGEQKECGCERETGAEFVLAGGGDQDGAA